MQRLKESISIWQTPELCCICGADTAGAAGAAAWGACSELPPNTAPTANYLRIIIIEQRYLIPARWAIAEPVPNAIPCTIVLPIPDNIPPPCCCCCIGAGGGACALGAGGGACALGAGGGGALAGALAGALEDDDLNCKVYFRR